MEVPDEWAAAPPDPGASDPPNDHVCLALIQLNIQRGRRFCNSYLPASNGWAGSGGLASDAAMRLTALKTELGTLSFLITGLSGLPG